MVLVGVATHTLLYYIHCNLMFLIALKALGIYCKQVVESGEVLDNRGVELL